MEYLEKIVKKTGTISLIISIIFAFIGIIMIVNPEGIIKGVSYTIGIIFILIGIYRIFNYYRNKGRNDFFNYDLVYGLIAIIIGIITMICCEQITAFYRIIVGVWITYSGILRLNVSLKLSSKDSKVWLFSSIISILMLMCGLYIIFNANVILVTMGVLVVIYSVLDIIESIIFIKSIKNTYVIAEVKSDKQ